MKLSQSHDLVELLLNRQIASQVLLDIDTSLYAEVSADGGGCIVFEKGSAGFDAVREAALGKVKEFDERLVELGFEIDVDHDEPLDLPEWPANDDDEESDDEGDAAA